MYQVFNSFLQMDTWHSEHPRDLERFNRALAAVILKPHFNPDEMANYMYAVKGISNNSEHPLADAIENRRAAASAVHEFYAANGMLAG